MESKNGGKFATWQIALTVIVALFALGKLGTRLYQENVVEPKQREEAKNSVITQVFQMRQAGYDHIDRVLKISSKEIVGEDKAQDGYYVESMVREGEDIVMTSVLTEPLEPKDLIEFKADSDKVKRESMEANLPDYCHKGGFFRKSIDDGFNVKMVTKDNSKKEILSYMITKNDCQTFDNKMTVEPEKIKP